MRMLSVHSRGHVLLFDRTPAQVTYAPAAGVRMLLSVGALEALRLAVHRLPLEVPLWLELPVYLGLALLAIRFVARIEWSQIGFRAWSEWNAIEKSYFVQILILANIVFLIAFASQVRISVAVPYLFYGFYQEVAYRGMLQTELVRRWSAIGGIIAANVLYTFGPLHSYYFFSPASTAVPMFAAIFAIGLFFGVAFRRSNNLWIVAIMHAIGNAYIAGSLR